MDRSQGRYFIFMPPRRHKTFINLAFWMNTGQDASIESLVGILTKEHGFRLTAPPPFDPAGTSIYTISCEKYSVTLIDDLITSFSVSEAEETAILDFTSLMQELADRVQLLEP